MAEIIKKGTKLIDTWKTKKWYKVVSPEMFGSRVVGETMAAEESQLVGRTLKTSLSAVTGDIKKQSTNIIFEIGSIKNGNAETFVKKLEISPSSIRRMIRKGKERIDLSLICATKDNVVVRIKPFLVTKSQAGGSVLTNMRNMLDAVLRNEAIKSNYDVLIRDVVSGTLQKKVKARLNRIYPLRSVEIRSFEKTITLKPLPPVPELPEIVETKPEETEEEKIEKKVKAKEVEETPKKAKKVEA